MRRFVSLAVLVFFTIPFGASMVGCGHKTVTVFCNGGDSGPVVGQVKSITLSPSFAVFGESVNYGQMGSPLSATAVDCKGSAVSVRSFTFASTSLDFADINPSSGQVCGGTWNRNTGGGIPDYTICTAPTGAAKTVSASIIEDSVPSATITAISVTANAVTLTAPNNFLPGQQVKFSNPTGAGSFLDGQTLSVVSSTGTAFTVNFTTPNLASTADNGIARVPGTITFSATNTFVPGQQVTFSGLKAPGFVSLNGQTLPIISANTTAFTVNFPNDTLITTPDNGTAVSNTLVALVTATSQGATSNSIPVYVHPIATSIVIGSGASCNTDPDTSCCPVTTGAVVTAPVYQGGACLSQGVSAQLVAKAYQNGTTDPADNITCQIGHIQYAVQNPSVLTINQNGVATAAQPGSSIITASISTSGSGGEAGYFATCPPASIMLSIPGQGTATSATVNVNTAQPLTATVLDTHGVVLTGVNLQYNSSTPTTIPAGTGDIIPIFPGSGTITAECMPPTCNSAPFSQIGLYGNGVPVTSNGIDITAPGVNSTVLYMASTQSQYLVPYDFSLNQQGAPIKLPYVPNSMVISDDGSSIYLGSETALMTVSATNNQVGTANLSVPGTILSISPAGTTLVVTDPDRQTVSLVSNSGSLIAQTGGVGTRAQWSPDAQTVYITSPGDKTKGTPNQLIVHSQYTGWYTVPTDVPYQDVAVMVPSVGAFFASTATEGRSYCPLTSLGSGNPPVATNTYYPVADPTTVTTDRIAATNDGAHILGATATGPALNDILLTTPLPATALECTTSNAPVSFSSSVTTHPLTGVTATAITGVFPASNSAVAFVTYAGSSGTLPEYVPATGSEISVTLSGTASIPSATLAPVAGVFSSDDQTFYAGTSGDNLVHLITGTGTTYTDTKTIAPNLPGFTGGTAVPNLLVQRPKKPTS